MCSPASKTKSKQERIDCSCTEDWEFKAQHPTLWDLTTLMTLAHTLMMTVTMTMVMVLMMMIKMKQQTAAVRLMPGNRCTDIIEKKHDGLYL